MENANWQNVLVEWVNCLKLSKNIQCIEDLRNGEFLSNLQKIITKSPNPEKDTLTFVFDIITTHYPNYVIANKTDIHLADLPIYDLKAVISLLMHYTCIYDRRDVLTSPLCHSLSRNNQLMIRNYLQDLKTSTTNEDLEHIVSKCIEVNKVSESPSLHWLSGGSSNSNQSPLQNILSTPVSRMGRFQEKQNKIAKLESELEMEKDEKREIQEQLDLYISKQKKLEKILEQKKSEISGLRDEIAELEKRTPPHYQDTDARMTLKRLRMENENLELYVKQLETENGKLLDEKDATKDKLKNLEFDCVMWQEKFFASERNLEMVIEQSKTQENQIASLNTRCDELTAMLNERKRLSDISADESIPASPLRSIENTFLSENLAHSVVDVQLKDVQKELSEVNIKLIYAQEHCKSLDNERQKLVVELANKKETLEQTLEELQTCHKEIAEMGIKMINQNKDISSLNEQLDVLSKELLARDTDIAALKDNMSSLRNSFAAKETSLNMDLYQANQNLLQKEEYIDTLTKQMGEFSNKCDEIIKELNHVKHEKAEFEKDTSEKLKIREENIQMTSSLLKNTELSLQEQEMINKDLSSTNEALKAILAESDNRCRNLSEELSSIKGDNLGLRDTVSKLENELDIIKRDLEAKVNAYNDLQTEKDNEIHVLKHDIEKSSQNNSVIKEEIVKLEKEVLYSLLEYSGVQVKEETTLDTIKSFQNYIQQIKQTKNHLNELLQEKEMNIRNQENLVTNLAQKLADLHQQKQHEIESLNHELEKLRGHITSQSAEVCLLNEKLTALSHAALVKDKELISLTQNLAELQQQKQREIESLNDELEKVRGHITSQSAEVCLLNEKLTALSHELLIKDKDLISLTQKLAELQQQKQREIESVNDELEKLRGHITSQSTEVCMLNEKLTALSRELLVKDKELISLTQKLAELQQQKQREIESLNDELEKLRGHITSQSTEVCMLNEKLTALSHELLTKDKELINLNNDFAIKETMMNSTLSEITKELHAKGKSLDDVVKKLEDVSRYCSDVEDTLTDCRKTVSALEDELCTSKQFQFSLEEELRVVKSAKEECETNLNHNLEMQEEKNKQITSVLEKTELSLTTQEMLNKDLNTANEKLQVSLANLDTQCRTLKDKLISLKQENQFLCDRNLTIEEGMDFMRNDLEAAMHAYENLKTDTDKEIQVLKDDIENSVKTYATIKEEIIKLATELLCPLLENSEIHVEQKTTLDTIKCFHKYIQQIQQAKNHLNELLKEKDVNIRNQESQVSDLTQQLAALQQQKQNEMETFNAELEKLREHIASQNNEVCLLNGKLSALSEEILVKDKELIDTSNDFLIKETSLKRKLSEQDEELLAKDKVLDDVANSLDDISKRYQNAEEELTCSRTNIHALQQELQSNQNDLATSKESVCLLEKELNTVKLAKEKCESDLNHKVETYEEKIKECTSLLDQTDALLLEQKCLNNKLTEAKEDLTASLMTVQNQYKDIEEKLAVTKEENMELQQENFEIQEKLVSVKGDLENKTLSYDKMTTLYEQKEQEFWILNCEIVNLKEHNLVIKENILRLEEILSCSIVKESKPSFEERSITDTLECLGNHIIQFQEKNCNLNKLLNEKDENIRKQESEIFNLTQKITEMLEQQNAEMATLKNELAKSKESNLITKQEIVKLEGHLVDMLNTFVETPVSLEEINKVDIIKYIEQQISELRERNSNLDYTLSEKDGNLRKKECEITNLSKKISELQEQHSNEITALKSTLSNFEEKSSVIKEDIMKLESKIIFTFFRTNDTVTASEANKKSVSEAILSLEELIENLRQKEIDMEELLNCEKQKVGALTSEIIKLKEEKINLEQATSKDILIIKNFESEVSSLSQKIAILQEERDQYDKVIKEEIVKLRSILSFLLSKDKARCELNESPVDIIKSIEKDIEIIKQEKLCLEENIAEKSSTVLKKQAEISELTQKIDDLNHHKNVLEKQLEKCKEDSVKEKEKLESHYSVLLDEHKSTFENLKMVSEKVTTELNNCKIENQILQEELAVTVKDKQKLEALLKDCRFNYNKMKEESKLIEDEYDKMRHKYNDLEKDMEENLETIKTLKEKNLKLESVTQNLTEDLIKVSTNRDELLENQTKMIKETENNVIRAHENAIEVKNDLTRQLDSLETQVQSEISKKKQIQDELNTEIKTRQQAETNLIKITNDFNQFNQILHEASSHFFLQDNADYISNEETMIIESFKKYVHCVQEKLEKLEDFENENSEMKKAIISLQEDNAKILQQKETETMSLESLQTDYDLLVSKHNQINSTKENLEREYHDLQTQLKSLQREHELLLSKFDQVVATNERFEEEYNLLQVKHESLMNKMEASLPKDCSSFVAVAEAFKKKLEVIFSQRNMLESLLGNMRMTMLSVQQNMNRITIPVFTFRQIFEKKEALEIIMEDIYKHSGRITKQSNELVFKLIRLYDKCLEQLTSNESCSEESITDHTQLINDIVERITDLNDRTSDALEQLKALNKEIENILQKQESKASKDKENVLTASNKLNLNVEKFKEEEWRKKNMMLKQKLTLSENSKSNLEKKLRQIQEENKKLTSQQPNIESDAYYKMLLQEHMAVKEDHERALQECRIQYKKLLEEHEELKNEKKAHTEISSQHELLKLQRNYEETLNANSKMEVEIVTLRQLIEERNVQIGELNEIKEAYEKLLEENNKLMTEVDTLKYKRARDRDEFVRLLKKDRDEMEMRETKRIQQIRTEYEKKLEKMKDKMLKLYKEEIHKEMDRVKSGQDQNSFLHTIENLRSDLFEAEQKVTFLEAERDVLRSRQYHHPEPSFFLSRESLCSGDFKLPDSVVRNPRDSIRSTSSQVSRRAIEDGNSHTALETNHSMRKTFSSSLVPSADRPEPPRFEDRRVFTLPRAAAMNVIEEVTVTKRRSISGVPAGLGQDFQMEDEDDDCFNNKYLTDMKEGRCNVQSNNTNRFSELAWRNSMQPPHLKSSYPAELQFASPSQFKEDDIKAGTIEMDNSLSRLLPGEKHRKKDFGTTSYKKPGPPTPSKNGGRLSLQGNELHPLREHNMETKTPKRTTPNRIKALFMGKVNSVRDSSENQSSPKKRVSFFRKPK